VVVQYRSLGSTGVRVSSLCLGTMMFGAWGNPDHDACDQIVHAAVDAGINFIDTADYYSGGEAEAIVGRAISGRRDDIVLATKVHFPMGTGPNDGGNSRRWILRACEDSLRRLGTDYIDLYQLHRPDPAVDIDESLGALSDLVHQGKVRYIGSSKFQPSAIVEAQWCADRRGHARFVTEQPPYSMIVRSIETDFLPTCQRYRMGVIPWAPLGGGWLSGQWRAPAGRAASSRSERVPTRYDMTIPDNQRKLAAAEALAVLAESSGLTLIQMALAFVREHPAVTAPIIGPRTAAHLATYLEALPVRLEPAVLDEIDLIVTPGTNLSWHDAGLVPESIADPAARRGAA
jgi:aryl-alcohol dehydrogenase-like predicted oxidoreductase